MRIFKEINHVRPIKFPPEIEWQTMSGQGLGELIVLCAHDMILSRRS